jgi:hypothetical protein
MSLRRYFRDINQRLLTQRHGSLYIDISCFFLRLPDAVLLFVYTNLGWFVKD